MGFTKCQINIGQRCQINMSQICQINMGQNKILWRKLVWIVKIGKSFMLKIETPYSIGLTRFCWATTWRIN